MHISRWIALLQSKQMSRKLSRNITTSARRCEAAASQAIQPKIQEEKYDFETVLLDRTERRKPAIPPFMKEVFLSTFNRDLLEYPEILNKEEFTALDNRIKTLESVFKGTENQLQTALLQSKLIGAPIKISDGGLAINVTERIRYLETLSYDVKLAKNLSDHWVALNCLNQGLIESDMKNLCPDLVSGDNLITVCTKERISQRVNQPDFRSTAQMDQYEVWRINGEKLCQNQANYFLTLCSIEGSRFRAFLVHPNAEGVTRKGEHVAFHDTPATPLSEVTDEALASALGLSRLDTAVISYSLLKDMMIKMAEYVRGKFMSGKPFADIPLVRTKMANAMITLYAAKSMAYFTAGLLDGYASPDADLEVAMCRTFTTEEGLKNVMELLAIPGLEGMNDQWNGYLEQFRRLTIKDEHNDTVNNFIALTGLHHAGKIMASEVKQMRNPLFHPTFIIKKVLSNRHQEADKPKLTLHLEEHLHPSLQAPSKSLEYCVLRLRYACETLLSRHGIEVAGALTELDRLAKAATEVYAMTSVLARASRSYCIGLRNAEIEMKLAATYVEISKNKVKQLILDIDNGPYINLDHHRLDFGKKVFDTQTTLVEKATERNWW